MPARKTCSSDLPPPFCFSCRPVRFVVPCALVIAVEGAVPQEGPPKRRSRCRCTDFHRDSQPGTEQGLASVVLIDGALPNFRALHIVCGRYIYRRGGRDFCRLCADQKNGEKHRDAGVGETSCAHFFDFYLNCRRKRAGDRYIAEPVSAPSRQNC